MQALQNLEANQADLQPSDTASASSDLQPMDSTSFPDYLFVYVSGQGRAAFVPYSTHEPPTK